MQTVCTAPQGHKLPTHKLPRFIDVGPLTLMVQWDGFGPRLSPAIAYQRQDYKAESEFMLWVGPICFALLWRKPHRRGGGNLGHFLDEKGSPLSSGTKSPANRGR